MNTISINPSIYNWAELYAKAHHISLNELAEKALLMIVGQKRHTFNLKSEDQLSPEIQSLIGIARPSGNESDDINGRDARMEYLNEKYGL